MAATTPARADARPRAAARFTETRNATRTSEFMAYLATALGVLIAGAVISGDTDHFRADEVWLFITVLTSGYMISRGLAKSGSHEPYGADERTGRFEREGG
jgi:hypothetical protein